LIRNRKRKLQYVNFLWANWPPVRAPNFQQRWLLNHEFRYRSDHL